MDVSWIFLPLKNIALPRKSWKTLKLRLAFFTYEDSTWSKLGRQLDSSPPNYPARECNTLRFLLTNCLVPRFRAREWRYVSVEVEFPARISAQRQPALAALFSPEQSSSKFCCVTTYLHVQRIHVRVGCRLAVETYCTVCTSTWSFAAIHLARRVQAADASHNQHSAVK